MRFPSPHEMQFLAAACDAFADHEAGADEAEPVIVVRRIVRTHEGKVVVAEPENERTHAGLAIYRRYQQHAVATREFEHDSFVIGIDPRCLAFAMHALAIEADDFAHTRFIDTFLQRHAVFERGKFFLQPRRVALDVLARGLAE